MYNTDLIFSLEDFTGLTTPGLKKTHETKIKVKFIIRKRMDYYPADSQYEA